MSSNRKAIQELIGKYGNPEIRETVTEGRRKFKATFQIDLDLHTELKTLAARQRRKMNEMVEEALRRYIESMERVKATP